MFNKKKTKRFILFSSIILVLTISCALVLKNINQNIIFFYKPNDINTYNLTSLTKPFRIGGLVQPGSVVKKEVDNNIVTYFALTDCSQNITVSFNKTLPNLFREKQGIVALGVFNKSGTFIASELLTKHSEVYTPPNNTKTLDSDSFCLKGKNDI